MDNNSDENMAESTLAIGEHPNLSTNSGDNNKPIKEFADQGLHLIMQATRFSNTFPSGVTRDLYAAFPTFNTIVAAQSNEILKIISNAIKSQKIKGNIQRRDNDEKFDLLLEYNDSMLERINSMLDDISGIRKNIEPIIADTDIVKLSNNNQQISQQLNISGSWNEAKNIQNSQKLSKHLTVKNIIRPQLSFNDKINNDSNTPFKPKIINKPNSLQPLTLIAEYDNDGCIESYIHPYEYELTKFEVPKRQLKQIEPTQSKIIKDTPLYFIDTVTKLHEIISNIKTEQAIAIDLEHHSYRSFQGITCLLQISTRSTDYIVDTLALRDDLQQLNEIFTNPLIIKVFHGADLDVEWLQRDLGVYVINMFDTHQAAKRLEMARLSLQFLLKFYCHIDADKSFQLADWRIRPLPDDLIAYARQDTHYLLYIFDCLTNELIKKANGQINLLESVYQSSTELCRKRYVKPRIFADSYLEFYRKSKRVFNNRQLYGLNEIYQWRDKIAREEDESYGYVLPNHMLLQIAESLPREIQGILACCNPIPPLVRHNLQVLHQIVLKARQQPLVKLIAEELRDNRTSTINKNKDLSSLLFCPHDLVDNVEFRDDLLTLLGSNKQQFSTLHQMKMATESTLSVFNTTTDSIKSNEKLQQLNQIQFVSPYARYLAILPYAEKQRLEEIAKQQEENKKRRLCPDKQSVEEFIIKQEPINNDYDVPLTDYGKRKRNEHFQSNTDNQASKKIKIQPTEVEIIPSTDNTTKPIDVSTIKLPIFRTQKNRKKIKDTKRNQQSSNKPIEFNYEEIDYSKFQGGSAGNNSVSMDKNKIKAKIMAGHVKKYDKYLKFNKGKKKKQ